MKRGSLVVDKMNKLRGVVVKIVPGKDIEDHGFIYVWQMDRDEYGADNCEHYCHFGWEKILTVIEE